MFIFKGFILYLVYLSIKSKVIIILNATWICALKKADNLTWSITFSSVIIYLFIYLLFFCVNDITSEL